MAKIKVHLGVTRKGAFGGIKTTSLCGRLRTLSDGMNLAGDEKQVTCAFCLARMAPSRRPPNNRFGADGAPSRIGAEGVRSLEKWA